MKKKWSLHYAFVPKKRYPANWESSRDRYGEAYTAYRKLQGFYPYEMEDVVCPPGFGIIVKKLGRAWNRVENLVKFRDMAKRTDHELAAATDGQNALCHEPRTYCSALNSARIGDEVWVLAGSSAPCVLRPTGEGRYRFVGDAYVHGVSYA